MEKYLQYGSYTCIINNKWALVNSVDHLHCLMENVLYTNVMHLPLGFY